MPRPQTNTVDYFPHDTDAFEKRTLTIIKGSFGLAGVGFWWSLLEWLGKTEGHYYDGSQPQDLEFLLQKLGLSLQVGTEILDKLAFLGAIDIILWEHKVIWSQKFVDRLELVYRKRNRELPEKPNICNGNCDHSLLETTIPVTETPISVSVSTQSKVKYSKVKYSKVLSKKKYGEFNNVQLTDIEYNKLVEKFSAIITKEKIESLSLGIESKGYNYKSHYAAILAWDRKDNKGKKDKVEIKHQGVQINR